MASPVNLSIARVTRRAVTGRIAGSGVGSSAAKTLGTGTRLGNGGFDRAIEAVSEIERRQRSLDEGEISLPVCQMSIHAGEDRLAMYCSQSIYGEHQLGRDRRHVRQCKQGRQRQIRHRLG
jgi:hypothetical protein